MDGERNHTEDNRFAETENPARRWKLHLLQTVILPEKRMVDVLRAIDSYAGRHPSWVLKIATIADYCGVSIRTVKRAIRDLEAADLLIVTRRERARRYGGQGPSEYQIVWSNLRSLAAEQGQQSLLDYSAGDSSPEGKCSNSPPDSSDAGERGDTVAQRGDMMAHRGDTVARRGDTVSPPNSITDPSTDPSTAPLNEASVLDSSRAGGTATEPTPRGWREIENSLAQFGVQDAHHACQRAQSRGLSADDVAALIAFAERHSVATAEAGKRVYAYGPGALYQRITTGRRGQNVSDGWPPASESYVRAERDQALAADRARQAAKHAEQRQQVELARQVAQDLEAATGAILDGLGRDELDALIDAVDSLQGGTGLFRKLFRRQGVDSPLVRPQLLQYLANRAMTK